MEYEDAVGTKTRLTMTEIARILHPISWTNETRTFGPEGEDPYVTVQGQGFGRMSVTVRAGKVQEGLLLYDAARAVECGLALFPA